VDERLGQVYLLLSRLPEKVENARRFEQLTAPYEKFDRAQYFRGLIWFEAKDETRALSATERAIGLNPDWAEPVLLKARLQQRISTTQAEQTLKDFLVTHPKAGDVRLAYARSLIGDKRYEAARREYDQLLAATPDDGEVLYASALLAMQIDDFAVAERHMKRLLELGVGNPNLLRFYLGRMAEDAKQSDQAIAWYTQVTPGEQYLPALGRATALLSKNGHLEDGRALLQKAAAAYPQQQVLLLIAESQLLVDASRVADAYELLGKQLIQQPDQPELLYESALLAEKLDRLEVMERNLRQLIRIKPDDAHAYNALGYSLVERNLRLDEAAQLIDKGLALAPDDAFIIDSKGWLLYRRGERDAALLLLQKAYGIRSDPEIAAHLGEVLWVSGKPEDALKVWEAALKVRPDNRLLQSTLKKFKGASVDGSGKPAQGSSE
jgi:tetratricopeptide (TPR) repeat protein